MIKRLGVYSLLIAMFLTLALGNTYCVASATAIQSQDDDCNITLEPRELDGQVYYEIIGTGFTPGMSVEVKAINQRTRQGQVFFLHLVEDRFSGIYLGFDGESIDPLSHGNWRIIAKSSDCVAKTRLKIGK